MRPVLILPVIVLFAGRGAATPQAELVDHELLLSRPQRVSWDARAVALGMGDVDGDGFSDLVASGYEGDGLMPGRLGLFLGSPAGLSATPVWTILGSQADSNFGIWLSVDGDVNGDGRNDVLVGAPGFEESGEPVGEVRLFFGSPSVPSSQPDWIVQGDAFENGFLFSAIAGDLNGDGFDDVVVTFFAGEYRVYYGSPSGPGPNPDLVGDTFVTWILTPLQRIGDVNGDGYDDLLFTGRDLFLQTTDQSDLYLGSPGGLVRHPGLFLGGTCWEGGDHNGDGFADIVCDNTFGSTYFFRHGSPSGLTQAASFRTRIANFTLGDLDGDGLDEYGRFRVQFGSGTLHMNVHSGDPGGLDGNPRWSRIMPRGSNLGYVPRGDVNGDGLSDFALPKFVGERARQILLFFGKP